MGLRQDHSIFQESSKLQLHSALSVCLQKKSADLIAGWEGRAVEAAQVYSHLQLVFQNQQVLRNVVGVFSCREAACSQVSSQIAELVLSRPYMGILLLPKRVITTAFIILWHMLPNSQTRIPVFQSYPSIGHHTFLSGMSVLVLCMEPEVQICPQNSKC